jgi:hypothetical protein
MTEFKVGDKVRVQNGRLLSTIISIGTRSDGRVIATVETELGSCDTWEIASLKLVNMGYAVKSIFTDTGIIVFQHISDAKNYIEKMDIQNVTIVEIETDLFVDKNKQNG